MIHFLYLLLAVSTRALPVPLGLISPHANAFASVQTCLANLPLVPLTNAPLKAKKPTAEVSGYITIASYANRTTCDGNPYNYFGMKQSFCYSGVSDNYIQYTCQNDNTRKLVNITLTLYSTSDCSGTAIAQGGVSLPQNSCDNGAIWSCTSSNTPWVGTDGTLDWLFTDKKCKKQFGYTLLPDGCLDLGIDMAIHTECMADSGTIYEAYIDEDCEGEPEGSASVKFSKCSREIMDDDYYYAYSYSGDDDTFVTDEHKVYSAGCCSEDTETCTQNSKTHGNNNNACFAASEMVTTPEGLKAISAVAVGDSVLTMTADGSYKFADVVYVPHAANSISSAFVTLTTPTTSLKATPKHMLPAAPCSADSFSLMAMENVPVGYCVMTVQHGKQPVVGSDVSQGAGVYTVVTSESNGHIVVNGMVASSFGINHAVVNAYYSIHRLLYQMAPWLSKSSLMQEVNMMIGDVVLSR